MNYPLYWKQLDEHGLIPTGAESAVAPTWLHQLANWSSVARHLHTVDSGKSVDDRSRLQVGRGVNMQTVHKLVMHWAE